MCLEKYMTICSLVKKDEDQWEFKDCKGESLRRPTDGSYFTSAMKSRYEGWRKRKNLRKDISTVWVLIGMKKGGEKTIIQVGRTTDIVNTLNEVREAVKRFYRNNDKKYGSLMGEEYIKYIFYEVNIDEYLKEDALFKKVYGKVSEAPEDKFLLLAYHYIRAAYVEGKIGYEAREKGGFCLYHKSPLDGYYYDYFEQAAPDRKS